MEFVSTDEIRVLHVDDKPDFAELTAEYLATHDKAFAVETASNADEALALLENLDVDCIVSDFEMPGDNGIDLLEAVRERRPEIPFVLFTGKGSEEIASEAISAGVDDYLQKSPGAEQYALLANRISNLVEQYRSQQEAAQTRRFFSQLIEHSTDVIPVIEPDGTIKYVSPSCEWNLGYEQEVVIGDNAFDYIHPDDVDRATAKFYETVENPDTMPEVEFRFKHADGGWVPLHGRAKNLLHDSDVGGIVSYNRIVED